MAATPPANFAWTNTRPRATVEDRSGCVEERERVCGVRARRVAKNTDYSSSSLSSLSFLAVCRIPNAVPAAAAPNPGDEPKLVAGDEPKVVAGDEPKVVAGDEPRASAPNPPGFASAPNPPGDVVAPPNVGLDPNGLVPNPVEPIAGALPPREAPVPNVGEEPKGLPRRPPREAGVVLVVGEGVAACPNGRGAAV